MVRSTLVTTLTHDHGYQTRELTQTSLRVHSRLPSQLTSKLVFHVESVESSVELVNSFKLVSLQAIW